MKSPAGERDEEEKKEAPAQPVRIRAAGPKVELVNGVLVAHGPQALSTDEIVNANKDREAVDKAGERKSCLRYMKREIDPCERWSKADTDKFLAGLQLFGTDFGMIETLFAGKRTRN